MAKVYEQSNSMQHWNEHQLCAMDVETTGADPHYHEICQIAILPLDSNIQPRKDVMPFYIDIIPEHPNRIDPAAVTVTKLTMKKILERGHDKFAAQDLLEQWSESLGLRYTRGGIRKRIMPLGHNYAFDKQFIQRWLGSEAYSDLFDGRYRDTMTSALFINDSAACHAESVPYSKANLTWLANHHKIPIDGAHDALQDCIATAEVYRKLCYRALI
jgi:DNA polymerase III epsilon subunit-like protein